MKRLLPLLLLPVALFGIAATTYTITQLTANNSPSDGTLIEIYDPSASPKSGKYVLTNLVKRAGDNMGPLSVSALTNSALTASRFVTSAADKSLSSTGNSAALASTLSDETGTGVTVFDTSPTFSTQITLNGSGATVLTTDAAHTLALRNGANAQTLRLYNTYTDASNYERLSMDWVGTANYFTIEAQKAGTGTDRSLIIKSSGTDGILFRNTQQYFQTSSGTTRWNINSSGHFLAGTDNTYDIGASGATRPRNLYVANNIFAGNQVQAVNYFEFASKGGLYGIGDGVFRFADNAGTSFSRLQFGGTTASFPAIKRSSAGFADVVADDSGPTYRLGSTLVSAKTADYAVTAADSRTTFTNEGTTAIRNNTLPAAVAGLTYTFIVQDSDGLTVTAAAGDTIRVAASVTSAAGNISATTIGNVVTLTAINATEWIATSVVGTWTISP